MMTDQSGELALRAELIDEQIDVAGLTADLEEQARMTVFESRQANQMRRMAEEVLEAGELYATASAKQKETLREDKFRAWDDESRTKFAELLRDRNRKFMRLHDDLLAAYPHPPTPLPTTATDASTYQAWLALLHAAAPDVAARLVRDAIVAKRADLIAAAEYCLESWSGSRNVWSTPAGRELAEELLDELRLVSRGSRHFEALAAEDAAESFKVSWRFLVANILDGRGRIDPVHRQVGALSPLLDPLER